MKEWLVANMGIAPERIQTRGFGSSEADRAGGEEHRGTGSSPVEIVIKTPKIARQ